MAAMARTGSSAGLAKSPWRGIGRHLSWSSKILPSGFDRAPTSSHRRPVPSHPLGDFEDASSFGTACFVKGKAARRRPSECTSGGPSFRRMRHRVATSHLDDTPHSLGLQSRAASLPTLKAQGRRWKTSGIGNHRAALEVIIFGAIDHAGKGCAIAISGRVRPDGEERIRAPLCRGRMTSDSNPFASMG